MPDAGGRWPPAFYCNFCDLWYDGENASEREKDMLLYIGLAATLAVIVGLSVWSGRRGKAGGKLGTPVVAGLIMGTLVGGSSTVGTAQLAYNFGLSAWWFTLGAGIACLILALVYAKPLRRANCPTLVGIIRREFGDTTGMLASVLSAVGTFINIISQLISATAVIAVVAPIGTEFAVAIAVVFMILYVIFGGTKGTGMVGIVKMVLLYISVLACGVLVLRMANITDLVNAVPRLSLFARGVSTDGGACLSLVLGVLTTQTYAQAVLSAKSDAAGVRGALISAFLIPPIGIGGILVGLYMRANAALYPNLTAKTALTTFVTAHMHPLLAGVILGGLFIAVVGTGAGLALGIASVINKDLCKGRKQNTRLWIVLVLAAAGLLSCGALGDTILQFAFMSMGLRGAVIFAPLLFALWLPGKVRPKYATAAVIAGPAAVLVFGIWKVLPFDSLFAGIGIALAIMIIGLLQKKPTVKGGAP